MAYLHKGKRKSETYLSICHNSRDETGQSRREVLYRLGKLSDYAASALQDIGRALYALGGGDVSDFHVEAAQKGMKELGRYNYGFPLVLLSLMRHYKLDVLVRRFEKKHRLSYSLWDVLSLLLCDRWYEPLSKRGSYLTQSDYIGLEKVSLRHLYRGLDILSSYEDAIQLHLYKHNKRLFRYQLDVVFFDVTTIYFDSQVEEEGALRQKGFSKDGKIGKTQVVFALLIDIHKNPIGYELYSGDQYEGHTLIDAIKRLRDKYDIGSVTVVADRGMLNQSNLAAIESHQYHYIIGERLKNLNRSAQDYLLNLGNYQKGTYSDSQGKKKPVYYCTYAYKGRTIIGTYSEKRAKRDKADREERIQKGQKLLKKQEALSKKAARYFLKNQVGQEYVLDKAKVEKHQRYDGFAAIATNNPQIDTLKAIDHYRHLFQIEHVFRTFKSHLDVRPMFHWTDKRIRGHVAICYIAFTLLNYLQQRLKENQCKLSERDIRRVLAKMEVSKVEIEKKPYYITAKKSEKTHAILKILKVKPIPDFILSKNINKVMRWNKPDTT